MPLPKPHISVAIAYAAIILCAGQSLFAQSLPSETDRLLATGRLWITVKYFHPSLASRTDINWDQALVEALPKIRQAQTLGDYQSAVTNMMRIFDNGSSSNPTAGRRIRIHHGFFPEINDTQDTPFYSAFLYKPGYSTEQVQVPMGGFSIKVPLSESINAGPAVPSSASRLPMSADAAAYPSAELRILAAYKIWGVLHYFFAYRDLIDEDWDALLTQFLPRLIAAKDALDYNLTIAEWLTHAADTFTAPHSTTLDSYFGQAPIGLRLRIVEKHVAVTEILDPEAEKAGVKVGDVVKRVDGETLVDRYKRQEQYVPASTPQRLAVDVVARLLNGAEDSTAVLTMEDSAGNRKEVNLKRSHRFLPLLNAQPRGETLKLIRPGIAYADLRRMKSDEVAALFEKFHNERSIIFDLRGVPVDPAAVRLIASRLVNDSDVPSSIVTGPIVSSPDLPQEGISSQSSSFFFMQTIPNSPLPKFKGRTVALVDERTIDNGEEAGLILEAANKTEFVGSPTAGAYSILTNFAVPGGITISFSGEDIRHGNGGKLQRLGLQPNLTIAPTLSGIRSGKDEVLEQALDLLSPKPSSIKRLPSRAETPLRVRPNPVYSIEQE